MKMSHINELFADKMENNLYFTLRGCEQDGYYKVPKIAINSIINWAGVCTDPNETEDYYKNPRAMFVALDLIYTMLDTCQRHGLWCSKIYDDGIKEWHIPQIQSLSEKAKTNEET